MSANDGRCTACGHPFDDHKLPAVVSGYMGLQIKPTCPPLVTKWNKK